ncbi:MAG TPA: Tim44-like domain-containing protein [Methylotenera sp.]|nr:Tim44-like domain-containing protein [Methylotenera sp.]
MKRFLMLLVMAITCLSFLSTVAEARRLGGGSSFGKSRPMPAKQAQRAPAAAPAPAPASTGNKWMGPLAGLAIGAGLATMFANGGLGGMAGGMGSILMALLAAGVIMFLISKFKKSNQATSQPAMQYAGGVSSFNTSESVQRPSYTGSGYSSGTTYNTGNIPPDFPVDSFLRNAKMSFIRLQAANDRKDLNDIREYTTPEIFAEISMQMQERGNAEQKTDVITINAELLEVASEGDYSIASVRFTGQLSENNGIAENVDEIWHIQKNLQEANAAWLLAGIQQTNLH